MLSLKDNALKTNQGKTVKSEPFCLVEKKLLPYMNNPNQKRLILILGNSTGTIEGITFQNAEQTYNSLNTDIVRVSGIIDEFNGKNQIKISAIESSHETFDPSYFLPKAENYNDIRSNFISLLDEIKNIASEEVVLLINQTFYGEFLEKFCLAPAAIYHHHAYIGGLMEHTIHVIKNARNIANNYSADEELVSVGALFHDIGKVESYLYNTTIKSSAEGTLIGHIVLGCMLLKKTILNLHSQGIKFPKEKENLLLHIISSHHGTSEMGSPIIPAIIEAQIVHYADDIDAKSWMFLNNKASPGESVKSTSLNRYIYSKQINDAEETDNDKDPNKDPNKEAVSRLSQNTVINQGYNDAFGTSEIDTDMPENPPF